MSRRFARAGFPTGWTRASVTITSSATPHAEGAYTQLFAATAADVCMMRISTSADVGQTGVDTSMLLTLAVGAAASEVDVVANIVQGGSLGSGSTGQRGYWFWMPLHIPAGSRISAKLRAEQVSDTYGADIELYYGSRIPGWGGYSVATTLGADTSNSKGTTISNTAGTWTEISASTAVPFRAFNIAVGLVDSTSTSTFHAVDVGVGGAGSEVIIGTWGINTDGNERVFNLLGATFLETPIPTGSRIAVKKDTTADLSACVYGWS